MRVRRFEWKGAFDTAAEMRSWTAKSIERVNVDPIRERVRRDGDSAIVALTRELDAPGFSGPLRVDPGESAKALEGLAPPIREAFEVAATNIRLVAEAQVEAEPKIVQPPQGQRLNVREVPVGAAGIYAPGGKAAYPSSVLMCCIPARVAGVERVALASPPGPNGHVHPLVLAAAAFCDVEEIYAMGGAQAVFGFALGTETIEGVDLVAGPGNVWVQEAKRQAFGRVGIDSYAGPSELMVVAGDGADPEWVALDLCAQAEHGQDGPLVVAALDDAVLERVEAATIGAAQQRPSVQDAPLALVRVPGADAAIDLANLFAPEHLELLVDDAASLAERVRTAGCVFVGVSSATAFGDYVAGSNHVLPTVRAGRFAGPLGPGTFRRKISTVEVSAEAAAKLAPHVDTIARAEGFPVHGESAMIRAKS